MKKKIILLLLVIFIIFVLIIGLSIGTKVYKRKNVEYGIKEYHNIGEYSKFIEDNIYVDNKNIISIKRVSHSIDNLDVFTSNDIYINTKNNTVYNCHFYSGCWNSDGTIQIYEIDKRKIDKILSLENEEIPKVDDAYWTLEYKDKNINIVNIPKELNDVFYKTVNN